MRFELRFRLYYHFIGQLGSLSSFFLYDFDLQFYDFDILIYFNYGILFVMNRICDKVMIN